MSFLRSIGMKYAHEKGKEVKFFADHGYRKEFSEEGHKIERRLKRGGLEGEDLRREVISAVNALPEKEDEYHNWSQWLWGDTIYYGVKLWMRGSDD